ncbi:prolyl 4-hydroxylase subunit alpha-3-like [Cherax quadricarinatus]|uniref:prolyl 4-hydroxylase subunit alpha-3-like n=1 Tax=Cherax quadricarinatus TaxID=27406 RepID=UPI00387E8079
MGSLWVLSCLLSLVTGSHDLHTSWTHMEQLWQDEVRVLKQIRTLIHSFTELNLVLQRYVESWEAVGGEGDEWSGDAGDPAATYSLLRHVAEGWTQVDDALGKTKEIFSDIEMLASRADRELLPRNEDVMEASEAVVRLAHVYSLNMTLLASGRLLPAPLQTASTPPPNLHSLSVRELASIGLVAVNKGYLNAGVEFLRAARARAEIHAHVEKEEPWARQFSTQRLDTLLTTAVRLHDHVLEIRGPRSLTHVTAPTPYEHQRESLSYVKEEEGVVVGVQYLKLHGNKTWMLQQRPLVELHQVERLCRGGDLRTNLVISELQCRYMSSGSPWLLLAPFKVEQVSLDPYIVLIYEVINPGEIEQVKERASRHLHASHNVLKDFNHSASRSPWSLKHVWLEEEVQSLWNLDRRFSHLARVTLPQHHSEPYMVAEYGLGGSYEAHRDTYGPVRSPPDLHVGERMASVLTFLQAPTAGGRTVFPWVGVGVGVVERAALLWWNLLSSHEHDFLTRHATCPVLHGSLRVVKKWVGYTAQWQTQPCGTDPSRKIMIPSH